MKLIYELLKKHFPHHSDEKLKDFLWNATCYPFGSEKDLIEGIDKMAARCNGDIDFAIGLAHDDITKSHKGYLNAKFVIYSKYDNGYWDGNQYSEYDSYTKTYLWKDTENMTPKNSKGQYDGKYIRMHLFEVVINEHRTYQVTVEAKDLEHAISLAKSNADVYIADNQDYCAITEVDEKITREIQ